MFTLQLKQNEEVVEEEEEEAGEEEVGFHHNLSRAKTAMCPLESAVVSSV